MTLGLLAVFALVSLLGLRAVLSESTSERLDHSLDLEAAELRRLARTADPATGRALESEPRRLLDTFLRRNTPGEGGLFVTFVDGRVYRAKGPRQLVRAALPGLDRRVGRARSEVRGDLRLGAGHRGHGLRFLAVPVGRHGVFVAGFDIEHEEDEVGDAMTAFAFVLLALFVLGAMAAWVLSRRVTAMFNAIVQRLQIAYEGQRNFTSDAGHELRTPITVVRGHLELMGDEPEERRQTVALVLDELDRMSRVVDELLVLARAQRPDFLHPEELDLDVLMPELYAKASALAPREWVLEGPGYGRISADRQRLTQAVMNLAENAVAQTRDGDRIALGALADGDGARIWVRDSGPGVPEPDRERIFSRFASSNGGPQGGTGLGLAIVRAIAEAHGGRVEVNDAEGGGALFTLVLSPEGRAG